VEALENQKGAGPGAGLVNRAITEAVMAQLIVRNLDAAVVRALKRRAAARGRSAEAEHRALLEEALLGQERPDFKEYLKSAPPFTPPVRERARRRMVRW
jgi:antitoxin FitA